MNGEIDLSAAHTPGPWDYVASTEHHGPYVTSEFGSTICDCYVMSNPADRSTANGGASKPISFLHEMADPNARLIAAAPEMLAALRTVGTVLAQKPITKKDDELWAAFSQVVAAVTKAMGDAP